jgi:hypothetical protein
MDMKVLEYICKSLLKLLKESKSKAAGKNESQQKSFELSENYAAQFRRLKITPPTSLEQIDSKIEEVNTKLKEIITELNQYVNQN